MKYELGEDVLFSINGQVVTGEIVNASKTLLGGIKYRVIYGVGICNIKTDTCEKWIEEKDILKLATRK